MYDNFSQTTIPIPLLKVSLGLTQYFSLKVDITLKFYFHLFDSLHCNVFLSTNAVVWVESGGEYGVMGSMDGV